MASQFYLFRVTHWLLTAGAVLMLLVALLLALGDGVLMVVVLSGNYFGIPPVLHDPDLPAVLSGVSRDTIFGAAIPLMALMAAGVLGFALIFGLTAKIVETAILGDPFDGKNATRLSQIGWLLLAIQAGGTICSLLLQLMLPDLEHAGGGHLHQGNLDIDLGPQLSVIGVLAVLLIFVLAQVFRRGSEMRAELEGTI